MEGEEANGNVDGAGNRKDPAAGPAPGRGRADEGEMRSNAVAAMTQYDSRADWEYIVDRSRPFAVPNGNVRWVR